MRSKGHRAITAAESRHLARVKAQPCSVCDAPGPSIAHHIEQQSHLTTIALCEDCHVGNHNGIHGGRAMWKVKKMSELDALAVTLARVMGEMEGQM